jgi:hypothetical protein
MPLDDPLNDSEPFFEGKAKISHPCLKGRGLCGGAGVAIEILDPHLRMGSACTSGAKGRKMKNSHLFKDECGDPAPQFRRCLL